MKQKTEEQKQKALDATNERQHVKGNGWLMKRGKWYTACWKYNGKLHKKSTKETTEEKARAKLAEFTAPFRAKRADTDLDAVAAVLGKVEEVKRRELSRLPALKVEDAFAVFSALDAANYLSKQTLHPREVHLAVLARWAEKRLGHPAELREIGTTLAREFMSHLQAKGNTLQSSAVVLVHYKMTWRAIAEAEAERAADKASDAVAEFAGFPLARLESNPWEVVGRDFTAKAVRAKGAVSVGREPFSREEIEKIFAAATGEMKTLCQIGLYTGLRLGDCCLLRWQDVALDEGETGRLKVKPRKTSRSSGKIVEKALGRELHDILEKVPTARGRYNYILPNMAEMYNTNPASVAATFGDFLRKIGIETGVAVEDGKKSRCVKGFHSFRYTYVSMRANSGERLDVICDAVGHASTDMTCHYWRKDDAALEREAAAVGALFCETTQKAAQKPQKAVAAFLGALGRADVADAQKPVFDAVCAMLGNLEPETLRAVASEALRLAMRSQKKASAVGGVAVAS